MVQRRKASDIENALPGENLKKKDPASYAATYNEDGSLKIKGEKPLAGGSASEDANLEKTMNNDGVEAEVVDAGAGHPKSEGSDKVEVKHPDTVEGQDSSNKPAKHDSDPKTSPSGRGGVEPTSDQVAAGKDAIPSEADKKDGSDEGEARKSKSQERREAAQHEGK